MSFLEKFRLERGMAILSKRIRKENTAHQSVLFNNAETIGVTFKADDLEDVAALKDFVTRLKDTGKKVSVIAYCSEHNHNTFKTKSVFFDYFSEKGLTAFFIPKDETAIEFIAKPFDILINFNPDDFFPINCISGLSKAKFRVGIYSEQATPYLDMMLDLKDERNIDNFASQLKQYLIQSGELCNE